MKTASYFSVCLVFTLFLAWIAPLSAQAQTFDPEKAMAAGDHKALAGYYRSQANDLKKLSEQHEKLRDLYQKNREHGVDFGQTMAQHCESLRLQLLQSSYIFEALAKEEEGLAKKNRAPSLSR